MANANPSRPGVVVAGPRVVPEPNLMLNERVVKRYDGQTVIRRYMTNGNVMDTMVFPGDYPNAVHESQLEAELKAAEEAASKPAEEPVLTEPAPTPKRGSKS